MTATRNAQLGNIIRVKMLWKFGRFRSRYCQSSMAQQLRRKSPILGEEDEVGNHKIESINKGIIKV